jgi:hypothetical protein
MKIQQSKGAAPTRSIGTLNCNCWQDKNITDYEERKKERKKKRKKESIHF